MVGTGAGRPTDPSPAMRERVPSVARWVRVLQLEIPSPTRRGRAGSPLSRGAGEGLVAALLCSLLLLLPAPAQAALLETPVFEAEVLLLDELGAIRPTEWVWDTVSHILNYRYNEKKTTIITTNFPNLPPEVTEKSRKTLSSSERARAATAQETLGDRITERMRSRLHEMCRIVQMDGTDYRLQVKNHNFR